MDELAKALKMELSGNTCKPAAERKYIDKVVNFFKEYDELCKKEDKRFTDESQQIYRDNHWNEKRMNQKLAEAKEWHRQYKSILLNNSIKKVKECIDHAAEVAKKFYSTPVSEGFIREMELLKLTGKYMSQSEALLFAEKHKSNYQEYKAVSSWLGDNCEISIGGVVPLDQLLKDIDAIRLDCTNWFMAYDNPANGSDIMVSAFMNDADHYNPLYKYCLDDKLNSFMLGNLEAYQAEE